MTTVTVDEIVLELRQMLDASKGSATLTQRLAGSTLTVLYEFQAPGGEAVPYLLAVGRDRRAIEPGAVPYDEADIVIRAEPVTLRRLTSGDLSGREAIVGGLLDIRKAPSLPKLLLMRSLFNRYKKALQRGEIPDAGHTVPAEPGDDGLSAENCAVEAHLSAVAPGDDGLSAENCAVEAHLSAANPSDRRT
jgi:hypothetical protein